MTKLIVFVLTVSLSVTPGFAADSEAEEDPRAPLKSVALIVATVVVAVTAVVIGKRKAAKSKLLKEALEKAAREKEALEKAARRAEKIRIAEEKEALALEEAARKKEALALEEAARKAEKIRIAEEKEALALEEAARKKEALALEEAARKAEKIREAKEYTAALVRKHTSTIEHGKALQLEAQDGKKMSVADLRGIYEGRVAALEIEKAKKLAAIHQQYPDSHSSEEIATAITQRDAQIDKIKGLYHHSEWQIREDHIRKINTDFDKKYPKYSAIHKLEDEHKHSLEYWHNIYDVTKNLTDGLPEVKYAPELAEKISTIINSTTINSELTALVKLGNLQEVIWKLAERGFTSEATAMKKIIEDVLMNDKIISKDTLPGGFTKPLLLEFSSGLKGVYKSTHSPEERLVAWPQREIAAYRLDQLLGLHVFPITVPLKIGNYKGAVQLFINGMGDDFHKQYKSYLELIGKDISSETHHITTRNRTFFLLTGDRDRSGYYDNKINPIAGRLISIDSEQAFDYPRVDQGLYGRHFEELRENSKAFYTDADFIARLDSITTAQLEAIFHPLFDPQLATNMVEGLHLYIRSYVDAAKQLHP